MKKLDPQQKTMKTHLMFVVITLTVKYFSLWSNFNGGNFTIVSERSKLVIHRIILIEAVVRFYGVYFVVRFIINNRLLISFECSSLGYYSWSFTTSVSCFYN